MPSKYLQTLIEEVKCGDRITKINAIRKLAYIQDAEAKDALVFCLCQEDETLRRHAAQSLQKLGVGEAQIKPSMRAATPLIQDKFGGVVICLDNEGAGPALDIQIDMNGPFVRLMGDKIAFPRLESNLREEKEISIMPQHPGDRFPIQLNISYRDAFHPHGRTIRRVLYAEVSPTHTPPPQSSLFHEEDLVNILKSLGNLGQIPTEFLILLAPTSQKAELIAGLEKIRKHASLSPEQILAGAMSPGDNAPIADALKALALRASSLEERLARDQLTTREEAFRVEMKYMVENFLQAQRELFMRSLETMGHIIQPEGKEKGE